MIPFTPAVFSVQVHDRGTFVDALSDGEVLAQFPQFAEAIASWRKYAESVGYNGPVAWKVREGFTLKSHAPKAGPCYDKLRYIQDWRLKDDVPTTNSVVFWVPMIVPGSTYVNTLEMAVIRALLRKNHKMPEHHCTSFGSIALLFALILARFKRTSERVPANFFYTASDSFHEDGSRLIAGFFNERGLHCDRWLVNRNGLVGFFLLGVETLGS